MTRVGCDTEIWELLPWYVNGSLDADEHERVRVHVKECGHCRDDISMLEAVQSAMLDVPEEVSAGAAPSAAGRTTERASERLPWWRQWRLAWGLTPLNVRRFTVVQTAAFASLAAFFLLQPTPGTFQTLSDAPNQRVADLEGRGSLLLRVVFDDELTVGALKSVLREWKLEIIAGPSASGVYTVVGEADAEGDATELRRALRDTPGILFVTE